MGQYAMLLLPSANRVYADAAVELTLAELEVFNAAVLGGRVSEAKPDTIGGVGYVTFAVDDLTERDIAYLSNASTAYALFAVQQESLLRPVPLSPLARLDDDLITIQKYAGKTNEQFTKLLLNVTLLSSDSATDMLDRRLHILDPLCGRGTTLNHALRYGYDAAGIELDGKDFEAYSAFVRTYLQRKRIKHQIQQGPVRRERKIIGRRMTVTLGVSKESYRSGDTVTLDVVNADTAAAGSFFRPETFDAVVADAPYGVQHGSRSAGAGLRRGPLELIEEVAPVWHRLLRPGAALGISWNTFVARRDDAAAVLARSGFDVLTEGPYGRFRHRVDQAISRDILIGRKPAAPIP